MTRHFINFILLNCIQVFSTKIINLLCSYRLCSNEDLIFLGQATMGIMNNLQNEKKYVRKQTPWINITLKNTIKVKSVDLFYIEIFISILQIANDTLYILYYDYWDLITKFWTVFSNWNTPILVNLLDTMKKLYFK